MDSLELLLHAADVLTKLQVRYLITGSMATITYGEARFTNDIDIVADLQMSHVQSLSDAFPPPEFYVSELAVRDAIQRRFQFNVIHPASGLKIDFMVPSHNEFNQSRLSRGVAIDLDEEGRNAWFASPEDVILKKLQYYRDGGSDKHLRDIRGVLLVQTDKIDHDYLTKWADVLGITEELKQVIPDE